ncbi:MAG: hypothetical protein LBF97_06715 [Elusimicrobiota bacterium]|jgi:hypothetical protein|nr:hypothetical protein [Elusimicrobiota bacterium]
MYKVKNTSKDEKKDDFIMPQLVAKRTARELIQKNSDMSCKFIGDDGKEVNGIILGISSKGEYVIGYYSQ